MDRIYKNKKILSAVGIVVVLLAGTTWLLLSGRVIITWASPDTPSVVTTKICGDDVIAEYNNSFKPESVDQQQAELRAVGSKVADMTNTALDPNCQTILFNYYYDNGQYDKAKEHLDVTKTLAADGKYATTELEMVQTVASMQRLLDAANGSEEEGRG